MRRFARAGATLAASFMLAVALAACASSGGTPSTGAPDSQAASRESAATASEGQDVTQSEEQDASTAEGQGTPQPAERDASTPEGQDAPQPAGQGTPQLAGQDGSRPTEQGDPQRASAEDAARADDTKEEQAMKLSIDGANVTVAWEDNQAVADLRALAADGPVVIGMSQYGGFEQVGPIGARLTTSDEQMTTQPGDIVLYAGDQISIFYGPNSWAYTKLGHISDRTPEEMADLLGNGDVSVTITIE